jgi:hypothetical protein
MKGDCMAACQKILHSGLLNGISNTYVEWRCLAEADASGFCPIHQHPDVLPVRRRHEKRDLTLDVLPWDDWSPVA